MLPRMVNTFLFRRVLVVALVVLAGGGVAIGQRQGAGPVTVLVDFNATGPDGKPFRDLTPADVTIRVGGRPRTVQSLVFKTAESGPAAPAASPAAPAAASTVPPPYATNDPKAASAAPAGAGRMIQFLVDNESLRAGTEAAIKEHIEKVLASLGAADRVAFSIAPRDTAQVGFGPVAAARAAVAKLQGQRSVSVSTADSLCRTADTLKFFRAMLEPHAGADTPMSVVFISGGMSTPGSAKGNSGTCEVLTDDYRLIGVAAAAARANVYIVQGDPAATARDTGLENLAGTTGAGQVMRVVEEGFAPRVLADSSSYWLATLAPDPSDRPGPPQRLEIKVAKEGVSVRARNEVGIGVRSSSAAAGPAKPGAAVTPRDMVRAAASASFTDLQLRALVFTSRGAADKTTALVFTEAVDPATKITALSVGYFDQNGQGGSVAAKDDQLKAATIAMPMVLGPGNYRIRVAATDASGKAGAVDINVDTALTEAGPFKMSSMLLGAATESGMKPKLQFENEEVLQAMFEMYGIPSQTAKMRVGFELTGPDIAKPQTFRPTGMMPSNEPDKFSIFGEVNISKLPPGDYLITAIVQQEGSPEGRVTRSFRKVAK